jgi:hypothetical protein
MDCNRIQLLLDGWAEGELESSQRRMVEGHLKGCPPCQRELEAFRRTIRLLTEFREVEEPTDFVQRVRQRIEGKQRRFVLVRLLPNPALARVLIGVSSVLLAAIGVWLVVKPFSPAPQRIGESGPDTSSKPEMIARAPAIEEGYFTEKAETESSRGFKEGDESEISKEFLGKVGDYDHDRRAGYRAGRPELPAETLGSELRRITATKPSPTRGTWDSKAEELSGVEVAEGVGGARTNHGVDLSSLDKEERQLAESKEEVAPETEPETASPVTEHGLGWLEREKGKTQGGETIAAFVPASPEIVGRSERESAMRGAPQEVADKEKGGSVRAGPTGGPEKYADNVSGDTPRDFRFVEGHDRESRPPGSGSGAAQPEGAVTDLKELGQVRARRHETLNGSVQEPMDLTGQVQLQQLDTSLGKTYTLRFGELAKSYSGFGGFVPEIVLYVKDREKAIAEIKKDVADFGGSVNPVLDEAMKNGRVDGDQKGDVLAVTLSPDRYPSFRDKLLARAKSPQVAGGEPKQITMGSGITGGAAQKADAAVLIIIRLIETGGETQSQEPPAE